MPQINTTIDIVCMKCGKNMMVSAYPKNTKPGRYVIEVLPCGNCASQPAVEADAESVAVCSDCNFEYGSIACCGCSSDPNRTA